MLEEYENKFGKRTPTEPSDWSKEDWFEILEECIQVGKTVDELLGVEEGDDWHD